MYTVMSEVSILMCATLQVFDWQLLLDKGFGRLAQLLGRHFSVMNPKQVGLSTIKANVVLLMD